MLKEFKEFALKGSVIDLAIGIIIGAAFTKIVDSLVNDLLMPPLSLLTGRIDFSNWFLNLSGEPIPPPGTLAAAKAAGIATLNYGLFLNVLIQFLILAWAIFLVIKQVNRLRQEPETQEEPVTKPCPYCASTIPLQAVRCPNCTSDLKEAAPAVA